jgi:hypothetical protein
MAYGTIKVDTITFTDAGVDKSITVSGLVQNPTFSGNLTVSGTISGNTIQGQTVSGATITGGAAAFTTVTGGVATITSGVFALGSASNPSISFSGDANSGLYSPGADQVAISTNGTGRLFVDASGRVGIGKAPSYTLHTKQGAAVSYGYALESSADDSALVIGNVSSTWRIAASYDTTGSFQPITFFTSDLERMRLDSSGRLGLGTSSPSTNLDIVVGSGTATQKLGSSSVSGGSYLNLHGTSASKTWFIGANYNVAGVLEFTQSTANGGTTPSSTPAMVLSAAGNVGIGTTAADQALSVQGLIITKAPDGSTRGLVGSPSWDTSYFAVQNGTLAQSAANAALHQNTVGITTLNSASGNPIVFSVGQGERARIDSSGRLLVGTSSSRSVFGLQGELQIEGTGYKSLSIISNDNSSASVGPFLQLARSRGTSIGSNTVVQNDDLLGTIAFCGADGSDLTSAGARINAFVDGTPGADDLPTRLVFSTTSDAASSPTERARITSNGVFKQSTSGSYNDATGIYNEFNVNNSNSYVVITRCTSSSPASEYIQDFRFSAAAPNNTSARFWSCTDNSAERGYLASNGGLYNYSANNSNLSDRNAKKDISPAAGTWDCLKEWEIVNFRYKDQPDDAGLNLGVIAQQVAESCPEVITVFQEAKEATEDQPAQEERIGVKEQQMMWMAIKALQEAQLRIETLEAEVAALKAS